MREDRTRRKLAKRKYFFYALFGFIEILQQTRFLFRNFGVSFNLFSFFAALSSGLNVFCRRYHDFIVRTNYFLSTRRVAEITYEISIISKAFSSLSVNS